MGLGETAGGFYDDIGADAGPIDFGGVLGSEDFDLFSADDNDIALYLNVLRELTERGVVLQQVRDGGDVREVVGGDEFDVRVVQPGPDHISTDAAEAVDTYFD